VRPIVSATGLFRFTNAFFTASTSSRPRTWRRPSWLLGVASLVAETIGRTGLPAYQQLLGEIVDAVETLRAFLRAAEVDAVLDLHGDFVAEPGHHGSARNFSRASIRA